MISGPIFLSLLGTAMAAPPPQTFIATEGDTYFSAAGEGGFTRGATLSGSTGGQGGISSYSSGQNAGGAIVTFAEDKGFSRGGFIGGQDVISSYSTGKNAGGSVITFAEDSGFSRGGVPSSYIGGQDVISSYSTGQSAKSTAGVGGQLSGQTAGQQLPSFPNAGIREGQTIVAVKVEPSPILVVEESSFGRADTTQKPAGGQKPPTTPAPPSAGVGGGDSFSGFGGAGAVSTGATGISAGLNAGIGYGAGAAVAGALILKKILLLKSLLVGAALIG